MGYTHYWKRTAAVISPASWERALLDCAKICTYAKADPDDSYHFGWQEKDGEFRIFGGGEWFVMQDDVDSVVSSFCKTYRRTYDPVVIACLCRLAETGAIDVTSDGSPAEWNEGRELAEKALHRAVISLPPGIFPTAAPAAPAAPVAPMEATPRRYVTTRYMGSDSGLSDKLRHLESVCGEEIVSAQWAGFADTAGLSRWIIITRK